MGPIERLTQRTVAAQTSQAPARSDTGVVSGLQTDSVRFKTLTSAFYQNAKHLRSKIAVWDFSEDVEGTAISYQLLAAWAGVVSGRLLRSGVKRGRRIPFLAQRGVEFIVGIIAALSCGAQIVAVDCRRPLTEVRTAMAGSGEVDVALSVSRAEDSLGEETLPKGVQVVRIHSRDMQTIDATTPPEFSNSAEANDACYSVFTSGNVPCPSAFAARSYHVCTATRWAIWKVRNSKRSSRQTQDVDESRVPAARGPWRESWRGGRSFTARRVGHR